MVDCSTRELVTLHLAEADSETVPVGQISEVLGLRDKGLASRVTLLSALEDLQHEGVIREVPEVASNDRGPQTAYELTPDGRDRATGVLESVADRQIRVRNGVDEEISVADVDCYLETPAIPRALARVTDDGVLYLEQEGEQFVGRDEQLATLTAAFRDVEDGASRALLVAGDRGIGKTTLVTEAFGDRVRARGGRVALGSCRADASSPYEPFVELLDGLLDAGNPLTDERVVAAPEDADAFDAGREELFDGVLESVRAVARDRPLVVVVDDLHLADDPTVALFEHLVESAAQRVLIVGTYDPGAVAGERRFGASLDGTLDERCRRLSLSPLSTAETRRMIQWITDWNDVPPGFVEIVSDRTGGNPLFVEELVAATMAEGLADPERGVFPDSSEDLPLPATVEAVTEGRLAALDERTREVLRVAALVGGTVPRDVLPEAVSLPEGDVRTQIDLLVDARVLEWTDPETLDFVNGLVREVVSERVPRERRSEIHRRIAVGYEAADVPDRRRALGIARHRHEAGDLETAFEAYREAGEHAREVYAGETARERFEKALSIARAELDWPDDDERILGVLEEMSTTHELLDDYESADRYLRYVAERTDDEDRKRSVASGRAALWRDRGDFARAMSIVEEALESVGTERNFETAQLLQTKGEVHAKRNEYDAAARTFERAWVIAEEIGDEEMVWQLRKNQDYIDMERGTVDSSTLETWETAVERARGEDERKLGDMLTNLGISAIYYGDIERARAALTESIEVFDRIGLDMRVCDNRNTLGAALTYEREYDAAIEQYERALETARELNHERVVSFTHNNTATVERIRGNLEAARDHYERALSLSRDTGNPQLWATPSMSMASICLLQGDVDRAVDLARDVVDAADDHELGEARVGALAVLGHAYRSTDRPADAMDEYERALELLDDPDPGEVPNTAIGVYRGLARARLATGDLEGARRAAETAVEVAREANVEEDEEHLIRARLAVAACRREDGDLDAAGELLEASETVASVEEWPVAAAFWRYERGLLARARGQEEAATEWFERALADARSTGMDLLAGRCRAELDA